MFPSRYFPNRYFSPRYWPDEGIVDSADMFPGDTTLSRQGVGDTTVVRDGCDTTVTRAGVGSASVVKKGSA